MKAREKMTLFLALIMVLMPFSASMGGAKEIQEKRVVATIGPDGVQRVEMVGGGYFFDPNIIVVKVNVPVELMIRKEKGITPHNIVLKAPEAGIDFSVSLSSKPKSITFTPTKVGKYEFVCTHKLLFFKSHKDQGMKGILEVVE